MRNAKKVVRGTIDTRNHRPDQLVASPELRVGVGEGRDIVARDPRCVDQSVLNFFRDFVKMISNHPTHPTDMDSGQPKDMKVASQENM